MSGRHDDDHLRGNENSTENGNENSNENSNENENGNRRRSARGHRNDRTGNGIVNHGPENTPHRDGDSGQEAPPGADGVVSGPVGPVGPVGPFGPGPGSLGGDLLDEAALRRMMRGAVQGLEPSDGTLDHLYRAVPARRARRRQALVGVAAAALLIGTAVPAFVHVAGSEGSSTASPAIAGHGEQAQGGNGEEPGAESGNGGGTGGSDGQQSGTQGLPDSTATPSDSSGQGADEETNGGSADDPSASAQAVMPACAPDQLGVASASTGAVGADGTVYGTFRIANVSGKDCSVSSGGTVGFAAAGAADPARIVVVRHTQGDPASGLPDPAQEEASMLLKPAMVYEVQFAWVPQETCPTTGGSPSPTPTDGAAGTTGGATGATTGSATGDGEAGTETQLGSDEGDGAAKGTVSVMHTPEPGAPIAETTIANACAGTIYRTGVLAPPS